MTEFTKDKLSALSIADLKALLEQLRELKSESLSRNESVYWSDRIVFCKEELNSRITDIFGPIQ